MMSSEKALVDMRLAELRAVAENERAARSLKATAEPRTHWSIVRLIRPNRPIEAA